METIQYDTLRNEILAEDCIKRLQELMSYMERLKNFVRPAMGRGFGRGIVTKVLTRRFQMKAKEIATSGETALSALNTTKANLMRAELVATKSSFDAYAESTQELIMTEPTEFETQWLSMKGRFER